MKFFNWMQKKFNAGQENQSAKKKVEPSKLEDDQLIRDWPNDGLMLSIGTFGNHEDLNTKTEQDQDHFSEFTAEEIVKLEKELTKLLRRKTDDHHHGHKPNIIADNDHDHHHDLPLDRFLNCPSSLSVSNRSSSTAYSEDKDEEDEIDRTVRIILGRCKDLSKNKSHNNKKKAIGKKSLSFLVKKMFVCTGGFAPSAPGFRDAFQESRMEKLLRTMLTKTIFPRNSSTRKCLEDCNRCTGNAENEDESNDKRQDGSKWIKTDSEFIVLDL